MTLARERAREEAHLWRARHEDGLSALETREFEEWMSADTLHRELFAEAQVLWHGLSQYKVDPALRPGVAKRQQSAEEPVELAPVERAGLTDWLAGLLGPRGFAGLATIAILAALALVTDLPTALFTQPEVSRLTFSTERGQTKIVVLPDKTRVTLGAQSQLKLELSDQSRVATLTAGNAFFDVETDVDRPFIARTDLVDVRVTGTQFDVQSSSDSVAIVVAEGAVEVSLREDDVETEALSLSAGQRVSASAVGGLSDISDVYSSEFAAWRNGRLIYLRAPLSRIVGDLNRYSEKPIVWEGGPREVLVTGAYNAGDPEAVLDELASGLPIRVIAEDDALRIVPR